MKLRLVRRGQWTLWAVCNQRGDCRLLDFLSGAEDPSDALAADKRRMLQLLERVSREGPPRNVEISHQIEGKIWGFARGAIRALWFYDIGRVIILSHGFQKTTQKTPEGEKERAMQVLKAYQEAKKADTLEFLED